jgi:hypothetical protein
MKLGIGSTYSINKNIGLEGIVFYERSKTNYDDIDDPYYFSFYDETLSSINVRIGVQIYLGKD